jgi:hypothetical protein
LSPQFVADIADIASVITDPLGHIGVAATFPGVPRHLLLKISETLGLKQSIE